MRVASLLDDETVPVLGGALDWLPLRRRLGITAFGTNAFRAASAGDVVVEEHVESPGQEEMYLVVSGAARFTIAGDEIDAPAQTVVFVPDPATHRAAVATEDETIVVGVGGWPDQAYHPLPWEPIYLAQPAMRAGDWGEAARILATESGTLRENHNIRYRLAGCLAQAGEPERALEELRAAIADDPAKREKAAQDEQLEALRGLPGWADAVGQA